jgi:hypothetical protein
MPGSNGLGNDDNSPDKEAVVSNFPQILMPPGFTPPIKLPDGNSIAPFDAPIATPSTKIVFAPTFKSFHLKNVLPKLKTFVILG